MADTVGATPPPGDSYPTRNGRTRRPPARWTGRTESGCLAVIRGSMGRGVDGGTIELMQPQPILEVHTGDVHLRAHGSGGTLCRAGKDWKTITRTTRSPVTCLECRELNQA